MMLDQITREAGAHKRRKRVGRGEASGLGKTCTRGNKGCQSRAGGGTRPLHEGGQMPIFRRLPKRGFSNFNFRTEYEVVNLGALEAAFEHGQTVDAAALKTQGLVRGVRPVKVLGNGTLSKKLTVVAHAFSDSARGAIEAAGGVARRLEQTSAADKARAKRRAAKKKATPPGAPEAQR
jgi:large subunit ribosomal protein L15